MSRTGAEVRVRRYPRGTVVPDDFAPGDLVSHALGWREYAVVPAAGEQLGGVGTLTRLDVDGVEARWYLGPLGGMGLTAHVGSLAVQIAKLSDNRVVASAGSDAKMAWLRDVLGVDAFNYRHGLDEQLRANAPNGIDVYFDSVGGDHLEAALDHLIRNGRVAMCGNGCPAGCAAVSCCTARRSSKASSPPRARSRR